MSLIFGRLSLAMLLVAILVIARFVLGIHMRRFALEIVKCALLAILVIVTLLLPWMVDFLYGKRFFSFSVIDADGFLGYFGTLISVLIAVLVAWIGWKKTAREWKKSICPELIIEVTQSDGAFELSICNCGNNPAFDVSVEGCHVFPIILPRANAAKRIRYQDESNGFLPLGEVSGDCLLISCLNLPKTNKKGIPLHIELGMEDIDRNVIRKIFEPMHEGSNVYVPPLNQKEGKAIS